MNATVPKMCIQQEEAKIIAKINQELKEYEESLEKIR
jgi:hypothetical protein